MVRAFPRESSTLPWPLIPDNTRQHCADPEMLLFMLAGNIDLHIGGGVNVLY